ncbi:MAG: phosphodiester glycosidase family protein [Bacteroidota bacterium]
MLRGEREILWENSKNSHPRTAIGYKDKNTLLLMVVQGRQQASAGVSLPKLAVLLLLILGSRERSWLRMDKKPINTLTKMDIFHERDIIVYNTYIIKE